MSTFAHPEAYRFSAGVLTVLTHLLFLAFLYLGVSWHVQQPEGMPVDLWSSLPQVSIPPAPSAQPVEAQPVPPQRAEPPRPKEADKPAPPAKADIEVAKKKQKPAPKPKESAKPKKAVTEAQKKAATQELQAAIKQEEAEEQQAQAARDAAAAQAARARAAITSEIEKYKGLIRAKIRVGIVMPPDVADDAVAEFAITLLPDGSLLDVTRTKSSGNAAYDSAVERAIRKAEPLPLPKDEDARASFINPNRLRLKFSPRDGE